MVEPDGYPQRLISTAAVPGIAPGGACRRLVQLVDKFTGNSPIYFFNRQSLLTASIDLFFFEEQQMKWSIIR